MRGWAVIAVVVGCHAPAVTPVAANLTSPQAPNRSPVAVSRSEEVKPTTHSDGAVTILEAADAVVALGPYYCPSKGGYWTPASDVVAKVDARLADGLRERGEVVTSFNRRYAGIVDSGVRRVCVTAVTVEVADRFPALDWRREPLPLEIGPAFIAVYDESTNTFVGYTPHPSITDCRGFFPVTADFVRVCGRDLFGDADSCDPVTAQNAAAWRHVANSYAQSMDESLRVWILPERHPPSDAAPHAALRAAFSYTRIGDYDSAIAVLRRFLANYGEESTLRTLERIAPTRYAEHVRFRLEAYNQLATTLLASFRYQDAISVYEEITHTARFDAKARTEARHNVEILSAAVKGP
jgi:hypothetical protein